MLSTGNYFRHFNLGRLVSLATVALIVSGSFAVAQAQQPGQKTFASAEEACEALVSAVRQDDQPALFQILGPTAKEIISEGDEVKDRNSRQQFVDKYREMHRLVPEGDGSTTVYVGAENWPLPILLMRKADSWYFDPVASHAEILFRRIGKNELQTIEVCHELVEAQNEYYAQPRDGGVKQFAPKFLSDDGKHNGLYWKISDGGTESPVGESLSLANVEDYTLEATRSQPFRGYYYRILKRQGKHATGGAHNYVVNGKMTSGFAIVAYPAEYKSSGVMTFIVNRDGIIYQKDLGPQTVIRAKALTEYDPDATWQKVE
jgi:hypothetical protein